MLLKTKKIISETLKKQKEELEARLSEHRKTKEHLTLVEAYVCDLQMRMTEIEIYGVYPLENGLQIFERIGQSIVIRPNSRWTVLDNDAFDNGGGFWVDEVAYFVDRNPLWQLESIRATTVGSGNAAGGDAGAHG